MLIKTAWAYSSSFDSHFITLTQLQQKVKLHNDNSIFVSIILISLLYNAIALENINNNKSTHVRKYSVPKPSMSITYFFGHSGEHLKFTTFFANIIFNTVIKTNFFNFIVIAFFLHIWWWRNSGQGGSKRQSDENSEDQVMSMKTCEITALWLRWTWRTHLATNGIIPRVHGNIKRAPRWKTKITIDTTVATAVKNFLENYAGRNANRITQ